MSPPDPSRPPTYAALASPYGMLSPRPQPVAPQPAGPQPDAPRPGVSQPDGAAPPDRMSVRDSLAAGALDEAGDAVGRLLAADPADADAWLLQAQVLERQERFDEALEASHRAVSLWPDVSPAHRLQLRLAQRAGDSSLAVQALRHLLLAQPGDPMLNSEMGARLSDTGAFDQAVPFLRVAAPVLLHENCSIWNYTTALGITGRHGELIDAQPLLDRMAAEDPGTPYPPFTHLAAAKLAVALDAPATLRAIEALQASADWIEPDALYARLADIIARQQPFALIRLDHALSRFVCATSLRAHLVLRPAELSAVANSVWPDWFGEPFEATGVAAVARIGRAFEVAIAAADVIGLPEAVVLRHDHTNFGFLAEMQRLALAGTGRVFTPTGYAASLHASMPFLRPLLQGLPFLACVGAFPELARRLGHFCGVAETRAVDVPVPAGPEAGSEAGTFPGRLEAALAELDVPFRGALFLVGVPGPYGPVFCARIKALGGIAIDIGAVAAAWAGR